MLLTLKKSSLAWIGLFGISTFFAPATLLAMGNKPPADQKPIPVRIIVLSTKNQRGVSDLKAKKIFNLLNNGKFANVVSFKISEIERVRLPDEHSTDLVYVSDFIRRTYGRYDRMNLFIGPVGVNSMPSSTGGVILRNHQEMTEGLQGLTPEQLIYYPHPNTSYVPASFGLFPWETGVPHEIAHSMGIGHTTINGNREEVLWNDVSGCGQTVRYPVFYDGSKAANNKEWKPKRNFMRWRGGLQSTELFNDAYGPVFKKIIQCWYQQSLPAFQ